MEAHQEADQKEEKQLIQANQNNLRIQLKILKSSFMH